MSKTRKLVYTAAFVALSCVANLIEIDFSIIKITFTYTVCFLAGIYLGVLPAIAVGCLGDLIIAFIKYGAPNPLITVASTLMALIPALVFTLFKFNKYAKLLISGALCLIFCTFGVNSLALYLMRYVVDGVGTVNYFVYLSTRLPQIVPFVVNMTIVATLIDQPVVERIFIGFKGKPEKES